MRLKIDKRAVFSMRYPQGTILRLTAPLADSCTPKKRGDLFQVDFIDDALQIHGNWLNGGSMALIIGEDEFEIVAGDQTAE